MTLFFFSLISSLSPMSIHFFFSLISIFLSHHTCLPFFSYLNFSGYICLFRCIRCGMLTASFVNVSFFYWWRCWVEFVILKYSILSPTCESLYPKRDERKKWRGCENQRKKQRSWKEKESCWVMGVWVGVIWTINEESLKRYMSCVIYWNNHPNIQYKKKD